MRTETKRTVIETTTHVTCDICGGPGTVKGIPWQTCIICKRDVCFHHSREDPRYNWGDYSDYICSECYEIGKPYLEKIKEEETRHEKTLECLEKKWFAKARIAANNKEPHCATT